MSTTKEAASDVTVRKLQELITKMSPAEREALAAAGVTIPLGDIEAIVKGRHKYGLLCTGCSKIALYFVGTEWEHEGVTYQEPPQAPCDLIAWTQNLPPQKINRYSPRCQNCERLIPLNPDRSFVRYRSGGSDKLKLLAEFEDSRDKRYDRNKARKVAREASAAAAQAHLGDSPSFNTPDVPASSVIEQQHGPGTLQRLEKVMDAAGVTKALGGTTQ